MYYTPKNILIFILIIGSLNSFSQTEQTLDTVYKEMPVFTATDSTQDFMRYIERNVSYPESAPPYTSSIKVFIGFTLDTAGYVSEVKVIKGVGDPFDSEAIRVVSDSPRWIPAKVNGKPVSIEYTCPVVFRFPENSNDQIKNTGKRIKRN